MANTNSKRLSTIKQVLLRTTLFSILLGSVLVLNGWAALYDVLVILGVDAWILSDIMNHIRAFALELPYTIVSLALLAAGFKLSSIGGYDETDGSKD